MLRQLMLSKKIKGLRDSHEALLEEERQLELRDAELATAIEKVQTDAELAAVEESVTALENKKAEFKERKSKLESELTDLEGELEELKSKEPKNDLKNERKGNMDIKELRESIDLYVRSKGKILREGEPDTSPAAVGFKVVDGGVLIPNEILPAKKAKRDIVDLSQYVNVIKVNRGSGKIPITKKSGSKMVTAKELEQNPALAKPVITEVSYNIDTYRGYIPVSQEAIEDSDYDLVGLIADEIADQELNTKNAEIATRLKTATAHTAVGLDGLKDVINTKLKKVFDVKLYASSSMFNALDKAKDKNGRYLLQDSITSPSGKSFAGKEVIVLDDKVIGNPAINDPQYVAFIGDAFEFCALFDRKRASAKWINHDIYGELLASFVRFSVSAVDTTAGYYVTYVPSEDNLPAPVEGALAFGQTTVKVSSADKVVTFIGPASDKYNGVRFFFDAASDAAAEGATEWVLETLKITLKTTTTYKSGDIQALINAATTGAPADVNAAAIVVSTLDTTVSGTGVTGTAWKNSTPVVLAGGVTPKA